MHKCLEVYSQINPFVVLNLLKLMITGKKFINFASLRFSKPTFNLLVITVWVPKAV